MKVAAIAAIVVACAWPVPAAAQRIDRLTETLSIEADGSGRVTVEIALPAGWSAPLRLSVPAGRPDQGSLRVSDGAKAAAASGGGEAWITIDPGAARPEPVVLHVSYRSGGIVDFTKAPLAHGNRRIRYDFVNTTGAALGRFESTVVLPPEVVVSTVDEVVPAPTESTVSLPYAVTTREQRPAVTVRADTLAVGGEAGVTVTFKPRSSPIPLLAALGILAGAYLYYFRDLTKPRAS